MSTRHERPRVGKGSRGHFVFMARTILSVLLTVPAFPQSLELLYDGAVFTEGPAVAPDGSVYFSDITASARSREAGHILRYDPQAKRTTIYRSPSGMANGIAFDHRGRMVVAEGADFGGRRVTRTDMTTGRSEVLASRFRGRAFNSPNDVTTDARGRVYFTDPRYVGEESIEQPVMGVYRIDEDRSVHLIVSDAGKPNGLAISPDGRTLYVASTDNGATGPLPAGMSPLERPNSILAYDLSPEGTTSNRRVLVDFGTSGYADGLTVDAAGNVYCGCGSAGVRVFSSDGQGIGAIPTPQAATNVDVTAAGVFITAGGALYRATVPLER